MLTCSSLEKEVLASQDASRSPLPTTQAGGAPSPKLPTADPSSLSSSWSELLLSSQDGQGADGSLGLRCSACAARRLRKGRADTMGKGTASSAADPSIAVCAAMGDGASEGSCLLADATGATASGKVLGRPAAVIHAARMSSHPSGPRPSRSSSSLSPPASLATPVLISLSLSQTWLGTGATW